MVMGFNPRKFFPLYIIIVGSSAWKWVSDQRMINQPMIKQEIFLFLDRGLKMSGFDRRVHFDEFSNV